MQKTAKKVPDEQISIWVFAGSLESANSSILDFIFIRILW